LISVFSVLKRHDHLAHPLLLRILPFAVADGRTRKAESLLQVAPPR
jgi:hypothetical protein